MIISKFVTYRNKSVSYKNLAKSSHIPIEVECDNCHKHFISSKYQINRNGHELCQACVLWMKHGQPIETGTRFGRLLVIDKGDKNGYSLCQCDCGNIKQLSNRLLKYSDVKSCGCLRHEHATIMMNKLNENQKGENHPLWNGGISSVRESIESTKEYQDFRHSFLASKNFTCEKCGSTDNIHLHHIVPFAENENLRIDPNNASCLCASCHMKFHSIYGKKHNNKHQLYEFLTS